MKGAHRVLARGECVAAERARDDGADHGDADKPCEPRNCVVDHRRDTRVVRVGVGENGRRERRDREARPSANTRSAGRRSVRNETSVPKRSASPLARRERTNMTAVSGNVVRPDLKAP
jgi:hypothetical protein